MENEKYTSESITQVKTWVPGKLFSFTCTRPRGFRFTAGQFARIGVENSLELPNEPGIIWRAYSMVSGSYDDNLEFFSIVVPHGAFTSHLCRLKEGDSIFIDKTNFGFLTTARFESGTDLWLLASGTGLAPFLSILRDPGTWEQFERVLLVYSARTQAELAYQPAISSLTSDPMLNELVENLATRFYYLPVVTREPTPGALNRRIPELLSRGELEQATKLPITKPNSRFMLCGNPDMVKDTRNQLKKMGFSPARKSQPGEIAVENYW